jgi:hypothetical protein
MKKSSTNGEEAHSTERSTRPAGGERLSPGVSLHPGLDDGRDRGAPGEDEHTDSAVRDSVDRRHSCVPSPVASLPSIHSIFELPCWTPQALDNVSERIESEDDFPFQVRWAELLIHARCLIDASAVEFHAHERECYLPSRLRVEPPTTAHSTHDSLTLQNRADTKQTAVIGSRDEPPHVEKS